MSAVLGRALLLLLAVVATGCAPTGGTGTSTRPPDTAIVGRGAAAATFAPSGPTEVGQVVKVSDGDTVRVTIDGAEHRLRYIGIDTPESVAPDTPVEPFALAAAAANAALVEDRSVVLEHDVSETDRFDRLLRYVWLAPDPAARPDDPSAGWRLVNLELVRAGLAEAVDYPPDTRYSALLHAAEAEARAAGVGLWADAQP
jgi:endonuclease YncB( thermonuclease family)